MKSTHIIIYGFGNLGSHLFKLFWSNGFQNISIISSQNPKEIKQVTDSVLMNPLPTVQLGHNVEIFKFTDIHSYASIITNESIVFVCVSDNHLDNTLDLLDSISPLSQKVVLSGAFKLDPFSQKNVSIIYPLYSFSRNSMVDWSQVPIFLENSTERIISLLKELKLYQQVHELNSSQRNQLHVAAVFANNFTNAIFIAIQEILNSSTDLKMDYLLPIIKQTVNKIEHQSAMDNQTGPAKRGDVNTIQNHLNLLDPLQNERLLYLAITKYIEQKLK